MARTEPQVNIRIPAELKNLLETMASENGRSLTAEIVARLQQSFEARADATQLEIQNEALRAQLESYKRVSQILDITQKVLAEALVKAIDRMPKQAREGYSATRAFADGIAKGDARSIGAGFLSIYQDDPEMVTVIKKIMADVEPAIVAKEKAQAKARK